MEICDFVHHRPATLAEACGLGERFGDAGRFLAGGTDLLVDLKHASYAVDHVIALDGIAELAEVVDDGAGGLRIGGMATLSAIARSALVQERFPVLAEAIGRMAAVQIRNRATIGGNYCAAVPCADTPPNCIVAGGVVRLVGPRGERTMAAEDFFVGPRETVRAAGEVLADVHIPAQPASSGHAYERFARRKANALAMASVAVRVVMDGEAIGEARVALGSVAPVPLLATKTGESLAGQAPTDEVLAQAAKRAADEARPIDDLRASAAHRRHIVEVLALRALQTAVARARG